MQDFADRVVVVTGAGKGLGRSYAHWFARAGARVVVNNRIHPDTPSSAEAVVAEITAGGGQAIAQHGPVETPESAAALIDATLAAYGRIDALVCNAGIVDDMPFTKMPLAKMHEVMNVNFWGSLYPIQAALPHMIERDFGRIVLSSSQAGLFGQRRSTIYSATKAALIGFARALAIDLKKYDIRVNLVAPAAYTPMSSAQVAAHWAEFMSPDKVAPVVGWLASAECRESGMIFNTGAGRVRRARIMETLPVEFGEDFAAVMPLDDMTGALEATESYDSGSILMPEMFAPEPGNAG